VRLAMPKVGAMEAKMIDGPSAEESKQIEKK
jgi:hypothetical protein